MASRRSVTSLKLRIGLGVLAFVTMTALILSRPAWRLQDFDQTFYIAIAYDLDKYGIFSNGDFSGVDTTVVRPSPGMFFGPVYPMLVLAGMKFDPRFAQAVRCSVEADRGHGDEARCEPYALPIRLLNAFLLAIGVVAVASAAELIWAERLIFLLTGAFALAALVCEAGIFSYIMTEAAIFSIYGAFAFANILAWRTGHIRHFVLNGCLLGLLCLTKPSFLVLFPLAIVLSAVYLRRFAFPKRRAAFTPVLAFGVAFLCIVGAWMTRNLVSVGKFAFTEEYGAAALIERFAYNDMTTREFLQGFPYCTPIIGELSFDLVNGTDSMHRFLYYTKDSFFNVGRNHRNALVAQYGRLDPLISGIVLDEMRANWWRHLITSIPLAWCGMWTGWIVSLLLVPMFAWACIRAVRIRQPLFLLFALPPIANLALDALIGNHYTRYNLILIGPYAAGAAWIISSWMGSGRLRWRFLAPKPLSTPSAFVVSNGDSRSRAG